MPAMSESRAPHAPGAGSNLLFLREEELRLAQDLMFFAYRDFTNAADVVLEEMGFGRAHHRVVHFVGRSPGITVSDLLSILRRAYHGCCRRCLSRATSPKHLAAPTGASAC
jgi:hypothetical protein